MKYRYYCRYEYPEHPDIKNPCGIYRDEGTIMRMQALQKDKKWRYSEYLSRAMMNGDLMTTESVTEDEVVIAIMSVFTKETEESAKRIAKDRVEDR